MRTFIELCSGGGGLSRGLIDSGDKNNFFSPLLLSDNDKICCETLKRNHPNVNVQCISMSDEKFQESLETYKRVDLLAAGIPCQSYSFAGKKEGLNDERGSLIHDYAKILKILKPKVFLIENVKGMLSHNNGETFAEILQILNKNDKYNITYSVLNANDYNVAQKRERLFIVGVRRSFSDKEWIPPKKFSNKPVLKDVIGDIIDETNDGYTYSKKKKEIMEQVPEGGCWVDLPPSLQKEYLGKSYNSGGGKRGIAKRLSMNSPCLTLTCSPSQKQTERCHPIHTRPLNIKEYARIQSFPDEYIFCGSIASRYKQIGNAVPVNLAKEVGKSILNLFE